LAASLVPKAREQQSKKVEIRTQSPDYRIMKSDQWNTYRTRFLVKAKQLNSPLSFIDHLGRQHHGRKGDYLVESSDGVISIAPRQIFEDIYVPMSLLDPLTTSSLPNSSNCAGSDETNLDHLSIEPLNVQNLERRKLPARTPDPCRPVRQDPSRVRRKSPQPVRSARTTTTQLGLM
jgi:hypothetical protein